MGFPRSAAAREIPAGVQAKAKRTSNSGRCCGNPKMPATKCAEMFALYFLCQLRRYVVILDYVKNLNMSADEAEKRANAIRSLEYL